MSRFSTPDEIFGPVSISKLTYAERYSSCGLGKGNSAFSVFIHDAEYQLKTTTKGEKRQTTRKPNKKLEKMWDDEVDIFLRHTNEWKEQIESYMNKNLEHLRANIFVKPAWANIVESHITAAVKKIEKLEADIPAEATAFLRETYEKQAVDTDFYAEEFQKRLLPDTKEQKDRLYFASIKEHFIERWGAFLSMSFHGGTDAEPAMQEALRMLETADYKKADVLLVSDFVMSGFYEQTRGRIKAARENKTRFHSLLIGGGGNKNAIQEFDTNWVYDASDPRSASALARHLRGAFF
jgi:uncharacterized protein with von Willebrand factor type A (vWA) domain